MQCSSTWCLQVAALVLLASLVCAEGASATHDSTEMGEAFARWERHSRAHSWGWAGDIVKALQAMRKDTDWMADPENCATAVDNTLQTLANEYTDIQIAPVLETACDHLNVYQDFGGHELACRPIFVDLAEEFEGGRDYAAWCEQSSSMLAVGSDMSADEAAQSKQEKIAQMKAELAAAEDKRARGEDIHSDLAAIKDMVQDAEQESGSATDGQASEEKSVADDRAAATSKDDDLRVGGSRWGQADGQKESQDTGSAAPAAQPSSGPYGVNPFGQQPAADQLTSSSKTETDSMVDQMEQAQVAEEKRSTYRALTRLRGTMITSYDGIANRHLKNIDEYGKTHQWRKEHQVQHLAEEESDVSKWAFPQPSDSKASK